MTYEPQKLILLLVQFFYKLNSFVPNFNQTPSKNQQNSNKKRDEGKKWIKCLTGNSEKVSRTNINSQNSYCMSFGIFNRSITSYYLAERVRIKFFIRNRLIICSEGILRRSIIRLSGPLQVIRAFCIYYAIFICIHIIFWISIRIRIWIK